MPPKKILAMKLRSLGDTVLMTAPLAELRKAYPEAQIHLAVTAAWAPLLEQQPGIHKTWAYERHKERTARAKAVARMAYALRKEKFDLVVNFHASPSSATIAFATGASVRSVHFHGHRDKNRYSTVVVPGKGVLKPVIERDMDAIRALGIHVPAGRMPTLQLPPAEIERARDRLKEIPRPILGLGMGASRPTKSWPLERFAQLAVRWARETRGGVFVATGPEERLTRHHFLKAVDDTLVATLQDTQERAAIRARIVAEHQLPLRQLAAVLSQLDVFAGNDSGPKHVAVATGTPTVTLFGPEDPFEWHPYPRDRHAALHIAELACRKDALPGMPPWCGLHACELEQHRCMRMIGIDAVFEACRKAAEVPRA